MLSLKIDTNWSRFTCGLRSFKIFYFGSSWNRKIGNTNFMDKKIEQTLRLKKREKVP